MWEPPGNNVFWSVHGHISHIKISMLALYPIGTILGNMRLVCWEMCRNRAKACLEACMANSSHLANLACFDGLLHRLCRLCYSYCSILNYTNMHKPCKSGIQFPHSPLQQSPLVISISVIHRLLSLGEFRGVLCHLPSHPGSISHHSSPISP